jgi:formate dehydrogenase maturation protein FdhE
MSDYETTADLNEAIYYERLDVDRQQAEFEAEGNRFWSQVKHMKALREQGRLDEAAEMCPHGGGYPLDSLAAKHENDPRQGEKGIRCSDCRSVLTAWPYEGGTVVHPCE